MPSSPHGRSATNRRLAAWARRLTPPRLRRWVGARRRPTDPAPERATEDDLRACYRLFLQREPDPTGWRTYAPAVNAGAMTVEELVGHFVASPEFREKLHRVLQYAEGAPQPVELDGFTLYVQDDAAVGGQILRDHAYEPAVTAAIGAMLEPGGVFVDVGASLGYFTVFAGRAVGPEGKVHAFEPGSQNHSLLVLNAVTNDLENVELHRVAVSDEPGAVLYAGHGANGFIRPFDGDPAAVATHELIEATTLDAALEGEPTIDVIKVDVEGAEGRVLRGAEQVLRRHRPQIVFELSPPGLESVSGMSGVELLSWLEGLGYTFEILDTGGAGERETVDTSAVLDAYDAGDLHHLDVLARPTPANLGP